MSNQIRSVKLLPKFPRRRCQSGVKPIRCRPGRSWRLARRRRPGAAGAASAAGGRALLREAGRAECGAGAPVHAPCLQPDRHNPASCRACHAVGDPRLAPAKTGGAARDVHPGCLAVGPLPGATPELGRRSHTGDIGSGPPGRQFGPSRIVDASPPDRGNSAGRCALVDMALWESVAWDDVLSLSIPSTPPTFPPTPNKKESPMGVVEAPNLEAARWHGATFKAGQSSARWAKFGQI